jgi:hypothetical protein
VAQLINTMNAGKPDLVTCGVGLQSGANAGEPRHLTFVRVTRQDAAMLSNRSQWEKPQ